VTEPSIGTGSPVRDRLTRISYAQLSLFSWVMYALGAANALLRDDQGTSRTLSGLHSTSNAVSGIIAGLLASRLIASAGRGRVLRGSTAGLVVAIAIYCWPGAGYPVTMSGVFLIGLFGTFVVISVNAFLLDHQGQGGPAALTEANALASFTGLVGPLAVGVFAATVFGWRMGLIVAGIGLILVEIWRGRSTAEFGAAGAAAHAEHRTRPMPRRVYWSLALIMCFLGAEFSMVYWSADLLRERAGFGPAAAAAALALVTAGMMFGRYFGSRIASRVPIDRMLAISILVAFVGFALSWIPPIGVLMCIGLFVTGLGLSIQWPIGVSRAVRASGGMTDRAAARSSVFGSMAIATAPFLLGLMSDTIGFHNAFLLVPALLATALILLKVRPLTD
jgi:predicted MFS family arabinose efflux permease